MFALPSPIRQGPRAGRLPTLLFALLLALAGASKAVAASGSYAWHLTPTGSTASLRGLSAVSAQTAWASGSGGTVLRTVDGGQTWQSVGPSGTADLQFRDIEAFDADHAVILSIATTAMPSAST